MSQAAPITAAVALPQRLPRRRRTQVFQNSNIPAVTPQPRALDQVSYLNEDASEQITNLAGDVQAMDLTTQMCKLTSEDASWAVTYADPAGTIEIGAANAENVKIPDGLVKFSVGAQQRLLYEEAVPGADSTAVPLDGRIWSGAIISLPCFRVGYIIIKNQFNRQVNPAVLTNLLFVVNNLVDWRSVVDDENDQPFGPADDGWFYQIRVFPPNYAFPDRSTSVQTSVESWRMTSKGLEAVANMPTLVDQGWWVAGQYPNEANSTDAINPEGTNHDHLFEMAWTTNHWVIGWEGLPQGTANNSWTLERADSPILLVRWTGATSATPQTTTAYEYTIPTGFTMQFPNVINVPIQQQVFTTFAVAGDVISIRFLAGTGVTFTNLTTPDIDPVTYQAAASNPSYIQIRTQNVLPEEPFPANKTLINLPPMTSAELVANNPKFGLQTIKKGGGCYMVHSKMQRPVYNLTSADQFGTFQFKFPGFDGTTNMPGGVGIRDSYDSNFSTAVMHWHGVSHATTFIVEGWMGWEGVPAENSTMGQFATAGLDVNHEVLELTDNIQTHLTGVYDSADNSAAVIATLAVDQLSKLLLKDATSATVRSIVPAVAGIAAKVGEKALTGIGGLAGGLFRRIKARRARRRAARM